VFDRANGPVTLSGVEHDVNLKRGRIELVLKQLAVEGVLERKKGQTYQRTLKAWAYPTKRVQSVTAARRAEQQVMRDYITGRDCRMQTLARVLDDPDPQPCGCCDRCAEPRFRSTIDADLVEAAQRFLRHGYIVIEPRARLAPGGLPEHERAEEGRALCRWGDEGWGVLVKMGKYELGRFDDRLVEAAVEMLGEWSPSPAPGWIAHVPSLRAPGLVRDLAERLGSRLSLPVHHVVEKLRHTPPQKTMENSTHQFHNVDGAFGIAGPVPDTPVLLVDDLVDSRWTFTVIARLLRQAGSGPVLPLALASSLGRDS
jgi:ATP-dependent DNA helicase RecQ